MIELKSHIHALDHRTSSSIIALVVRLPHPTRFAHSLLSACGEKEFSPKKSKNPKIYFLPLPPRRPDNARVPA
jgi:hypothetical protein